MLQHRSQEAEVIATVMDQRMLKRYDESIGETESTDAEEYTVEQVIESLKWGRYHYFLLLLFGAFKAIDRLEITLMTVLFPAVQCEWHLSGLQSTLLSVVVFTGMMFGAAFWGVTADDFGRKPTIFIATALVAYVGFLTSFSPTLYWLFILRFVVGIGVVGAIQVEVILIEFVAAKYRAAAMISLRAIENIGGLFEVLLAWAVIPTLGWRYLIAFTAIPTTLFLLLWPVVPESVRFLLISGQKEKAIKTLTRAAEMNRCSLPAGRLRAAVVENRGRLGDLFHAEYRRSTIQMLFIFFATTATYYGAALITTELFSVDYCAAPNVTSSSDASSSDGCGCSSLSSSDYGRILLTSLAELAILPIAIVLSDLIGRRRTLAICQIAVALSYLVLLTCVGSTWGVTVILFVVRGFAMGSTAIIHLYAPELFPTQIRAIGTSSGYFVGRIGAMITPLISQLLLRRSVHSALLVYATICIVGAITALLLPIETKGRRME